MIIVKHKHVVFLLNMVGHLGVGSCLDRFVLLLFFIAPEQAETHQSYHEDGYQEETE